MVVTAPLLWLFAHDLLQRGAQLRRLMFTKPFTFNVIQCEQRFTQCESQCRADFQDGKMIAHQLSIGLRRLVIRRVRLVHHARLPFDKAAQFMGPLRLIVLHAVMIKLNARLHHQRNGSRPGIDQFGLLPGQAMDFKRLLHRPWRGDLHTFQRLLCAARRTRGNPGAHCRPDGSRDPAADGPAHPRGRQDLRQRHRRSARSGRLPALLRSAGA
ncbi:hypothetical protein D3C71_1603240 [compost metagenome]